MTIFSYVYLFYVNLIRAKTDFCGQLSSFSSPYPHFTPPRMIRRKTPFLSANIYHTFLTNGALFTGNICCFARSFFSLLYKGIYKVYHSGLEWYLDKGQINTPPLSQSGGAFIFVRLHQQALPHVNAAGGLT